MADSCCARDCNTAAVPDRRYQTVLVAALFINVAMFAIETVAGWNAASAALLADALDFFGDASNYLLSFAMLVLAPLWRSRAALIKSASMAAFGLFVLGKATWNAASNAMPEPLTMGLVGLMALAANASVALLLYAYRQGDADTFGLVMQSQRCHWQHRCSLGGLGRVWIRRSLAGFNRRSHHGSACVIGCAAGLEAGTHRVKRIADAVRE